MEWNIIWNSKELSRGFEHCSNGVIIRGAGLCIDDLYGGSGRSHVEDQRGDLDSHRYPLVVIGKL